MLSRLNHPLILISLIFILIISIRFLFHFSTSPEFKPGQEVEIEHTFMEIPDSNDFSQYFYIDNVLVVLDRYPEYEYGDKITLKGVVEESISSNNEDLRTRLVIRNPEVEMVNDKALAVLSFFRQKVLLAYKSILPPKEAGLMAGIVLGAEEGINDEFKEDLKDTGMLHVVVASGSNVVLVAGFIFALIAGRMKKKYAVVFTISGIFLYALLTGFDSPIVRASIMASFAFSAMIFGRQKIALMSLFFAGWLMLMVSPDLIYDIGFQLSFSATLGIMLFQRVIIAFARILPNAIKEDFATTFSAQIGAMPFLLVAFGEVNLLSIFTNVILLWTVPVIMVFGLVAGVMGLILPILAFPFVLLAYPFLAFFSGVVDISSNFYVPLTLTSAALPVAIIYYLFVVLLLLKRRGKL